MTPSRIKALMEEGVKHHGAGRLGDADLLYGRVRAAAPQHFDAVHLAGLVAYQQSRNQEAADLLRRALRLNPASTVCEMRLGVALAALGDTTLAQAHLTAATERAPRMPEPWLHLGIVQRAVGLPVEARASLERAVTLKEDLVEALEHLGALVSVCEGFAAAVPFLRRVTLLRPADPKGLANLGIALAQSGAPDEALRFLNRALQLDGAHAAALTGKALVLQNTYRTAEAAATYKTALEHNPGNHEARSGRLLCLHYLDGISREALHAEHLEFGAAVPECPPSALPNAPDPGRRLRVGFLSPDLRAHSVAYFLEPLLARIDRTRFETFLYHDHARVDAMSGRLRAHAAHWRHVAGLSHASVESVIRADAPDILVDLAGHTGHNRLALFGRRLAPVQMTYLGYPDTTGLKEMDFRLVDAVTDPEGDADRFHSERLLRFAPTAWSYAPPECAPAPLREAAPVGHVVFGCFNNVCKVSDATLRCWAAVLDAVPGSSLFLKGHGLSDAPVAAKLLERFTHFGIGQGRVELAGRAPSLPLHLACYGRVDVALDTFPYHGTTTTCEALWMGVPVVTLKGDRHASRVGASLLAAAGHPEWVAREPAEYVRIAAQLARDASLRGALRQALRDDMRRGALLDHAGQAARFGAALRTAWWQWCAARASGAPDDGLISLHSTAHKPITAGNHDFSAVSA